MYDSIWIHLHPEHSWIESAIVFSVNWDTEYKWEETCKQSYALTQSSGLTGGSKQITEANLPAHTHTFTGTQATDSIQFRRSDNGSNTAKYANNGIYSLNTESGKTSSYQLTSEQVSNTWDVVTWTYTPSGSLSSTGSGEEFLPPYITVYAWYRTK